MPTIIQTIDKEQTFALNTYELTLSCGKCHKGQLVATDRPTIAGATIHSCTHCNRELSITGESYPRTVVKREPVSDRYLTHMEEVPDKDPDLYDQTEVSLLPQDKKVELLLTTLNPVIIDHLQKATIHSVHHTLDYLLEALFDMAKEAARIRAEGIPESELEEPLTRSDVNDMSFSKLVELIESTNQRPENIDMIRKKSFGVLHNNEFRAALYNTAREVVNYRKQQNEVKPEAVETVAQPARNKAGRPRKQLIVT